MNAQNERGKFILKASLYVSIITTVVSQLTMQLLGGNRHDSSYWSQEIENLGEELIFENGLPPFISSAGVFPPESYIFGIGLTITGILFILLSYEMANLQEITLSKDPKSTKFSYWSNKLGLIFGVFTGASIILISWTPMDTQLMAHIQLAIQVFYGALLWASFATISRTSIDNEVRVKNISINTIRWSLIVLAFTSLQLIPVAIIHSMLNLAALFEWIMFFSLCLVLFSFNLIFTSTPIIEEE